MQFQGEAMALCSLGSFVFKGLVAMPQLPRRLAQDMSAYLRQNRQGVMGS